MQAQSGVIKLSFLHISDEVTVSLLFFLEIGVLDANIIEDITKKYVFFALYIVPFLGNISF
jgi:hypothetical protein